MQLHHNDDLNNVVPYSFCITLNFIFLDFRDIFLETFKDSCVLEPLSSVISTVLVKTNELLSSYGSLTSHIRTVTLGHAVPLVNAQSHNTYCMVTILVSLLCTSYLRGKDFSCASGLVFWNWVGTNTDLSSFLNWHQWTDANWKCTVSLWEIMHVKYWL